VPSGEVLPTNIPSTTHSFRVTGAKPRGSVEFFVCPGSDEYDSLMTCPRPPIRPVCHVPSWKLWW
jgi:hypothetical protein